MSDQQPGALDQAYAALGHVGAQLQNLHRDQQQALRDLEARERDLQAQLDKADPGSEQARQIEAELDELTRAWRVATEDVAEPPPGA